MVCDTVRFVKHIDAKQFKAGTCNTTYGVVINLPKSGIAPAEHNNICSLYE